MSTNTVMYEDVGDTLAPSRIAPGYRMLGLLQRGEDFDTYDAWSEQRFSRCVVKTMRADRPARRSAAARLVREGEVLGSLAHPNLVRAYEVRQGRRPIVVLETLTGATLRYILQQSGRLVVPDVAELGVQLCSALRYLHAHGVLHLDVKPGNVVIDGYRATLIDLSLALPPGPCSRGRGTTAYLSPEQAHGDEVSAASDVWGLGSTLFRAATGTRPFDRLERTSEPTQADVGPDAATSVTDRCSCCGRRKDYDQLRGRAPAVRTVRRLPAGLARAIDATLEPSPADRPSLSEFADVLTGFLPE